MHKKNSIITKLYDQLTNVASIVETGKLTGAEVSTQ